MCRTAEDMTFSKQHEKGEHCGLHFTLHWALVTPVMEPGETMFAHPRRVGCGQPVGHGPGSLGHCTEAYPWVTTYMFKVQPCAKACRIRIGVSL